MERDRLRDKIDIEVGVDGVERDRLGRKSVTKQMTMARREPDWETKSTLRHLSMAWKEILLGEKLSD